MSNARQNSPRDTSGTSPLGGLEGITKSLQSQLATAAALPHALMEAQLAFGSELMTFVGQRMKAQAELFGALSHCHELSEAVEAQRKFNERVASDYSAEFGQLTELMRKEMTTVQGVLAQSVEGASKLAKAAA
jgi:hypothetical protein